MAYRTFIFPCGLRLVYLPSTTQVAYCGYVINCGTRDEQPGESGMAHFVEHLLFKGTQHRRAWHILNRMEAVGGDLNAFTNKEDTTLYAAFLSEHFQRAAELLTDIVFYSTFPQHEMDHEVQVVCDEIDSYQDTPSEQIFDDFEDLVFHGHPLGRNILGNPEALRSYHSEQIQAFWRRNYQPQNMVFFFRGDISFHNVVRTMEKLLTDIHSDTAWVRPERKEPAPYQPQHIQRHLDTHQAHVMLGCRSYASGNPHRTALYLLNNLLGGPGMNSRLNVTLRERRGLVYNVESNLANYTDTGIFSIYFGSDQQDVNHCLRLCHQELQRLIDFPLTSSQLNAARKQLRGQIGVSCDNHENTILDIAKAYLHYDSVETTQEIYDRLDALTPQMLQETAQELFQEQNLSQLVFL